jgi:hypothetical protein
LNQDRRIPSVVRDFGIDRQSDGALSFLDFRDWIARKEHQAKDWIVAACSHEENSGASEFFTFSVLCPAEEATMKRLLSTPDWGEVRPELGMLSFSPSENGEVLNYDPGLEASLDGTKLKPFTIRRNFHGYKPAVFELVQNFLLYHEAFFEADKCEYRHIDEDGGIQTVARLDQRNDDSTILVDAHHLKDYLAANRCCLLRLHDHRRKTTEDINSLIGGERRQTSLTGADFHFLLVLFTEGPWNGWRSFSRLTGKDLIRPYPEPDKSHTSWATGELREQYESFIIGTHENGTPIESTCDENRLSNYFTDRGTPHFLTPVFFSPDVLSKYREEPKRYHVNAGSVSCLDIWTIDIDITGEQLVQVWLGDLGGIPCKEQKHWRQFNVPPRGTITKERFARDFMAEFVPSTDPIYNFHVAFETLQRVTKEELGEELFRVLDPKDQHAYQTIHLPVTDEWKEFDEQILSLAKVTVDSLNVNFLWRKSGKTMDEDAIKGPLDLLEAWLNGIGADEIVGRTILRPLRAIWRLRSAGAAHRKGAEFSKVLSRYELENMSNYARLKKLVTELTSALIMIADRLHQTDSEY